MNHRLEKIALNALKARQMAKEVGLVPKGDWRWALRNLRGKRGEPLQGKELEEAKLRIGKMPKRKKAGREM